MLWQQKGNLEIDGIGTLLTLTRMKYWIIMFNNFLRMGGKSSGLAPMTKAGTLSTEKTSLILYTFLKMVI